MLRETGLPRQPPAHRQTAITGLAKKRAAARALRRPTAARGQPPSRANRTARAWRSLQTWPTDVPACRQYEVSSTENAPSARLTYRDQSCIRPGKFQQGQSQDRVHGDGLADALTRVQCNQFTRCPCVARLLFCARINGGTRKSTHRCTARQPGWHHNALQVALR